jgi:hypothetical protein
MRETLILGFSQHHRRGLVALYDMYRATAQSILDGRHAATLEFRDS